ncbi:MAG: metallophosphoesterase [Adhaeribacter sp.]
MLSRIITISILILIALLVDWYVFQALRTITHNLPLRQQRMWQVFYWSLSVLTAATIIGFSLTRGAPPSHLKTYLVSTVFIIFACKMVVVLFLLVDDGMRLAKYLFISLSPASTGPQPASAEALSRSAFLSKLGFLAAGIPLVAFVYGMVRGAYNYQVKRITLKTPKLPPAFDGYRILQISDLHTGSFPGPEPLQKAVELINQQGADLIFFTGDLVNNIASEVTMHQPALSQLKAKDGVYSVLGNHDYGDYVSWDSRQAKEQNLETLKQTHKQMGWRLLLNESASIHRQGERLAVIGVENWSTRMNFPKYGDLARAYAGAAGAPFKILLSHDPSHWDGEINRQYPDIDLTLSGHTHGMQFGVNIPGFRWSPVQYVYKQWAGLYQKGSQFLYVNTGLGFLGYPGRVGFLPEITVIELKRA